MRREDRKALGVGGKGSVCVFPGHEGWRHHQQHLEMCVCSGQARILCPLKNGMWVCFQYVFSEGGHKSVSD